MRVSEIHVKRMRVNQGLGVYLCPSLGNLTTYITILLTIAVGPNRHDYSIDWSDDKL